MSTSGAQRSIELIACDVGIRMRISPHTLRLAYATRQLERSLSLLLRDGVILPSRTDSSLALPSAIEVNHGKQDEGVYKECQRTQA